MDTASLHPTSSESLDRLQHSAELLNSILIAGSALAGTVVLLKIVGKGEFEAWKVPINLSYACLVFGALTVAHLYVAVLVISDAHNIFYRYHDSAEAAWEKLVGSKALFFHGLVARVHFTEKHIPGVPYPVRVYKMSSYDPTTWLSRGVAILVFCASVRWVNAIWQVRLSTTVAALVIVYLNWKIGANWVVAISELTLPDGKSSYFNKGWIQLLFVGS